MHRSTLSIRAAGLAPHEFGECLDECATTAEENTVISVGGDDTIGLGDGGLHPDGHRLLSVVEVAKPPDQLGLVERISGDLHATHEGHVAEEGEELLRRGLDDARGRLDLVARERDAGLDGEDRLVGGGEEARRHGTEERAGRSGGDGAAEERAGGHG